MEGANSFLKELLLFGKGLKARGKPSHVSNRMHLTMDNLIQICSFERPMLGLYLYDMVMY